MEMFIKGLELLHPSPLKLKKVQKFTQLVQKNISRHLIFFVKIYKNCHVIAHKAC